MEYIKSGSALDDLNISLLKSRAILGCFPYTIAQSLLSCNVGHGHRGLVCLFLDRPRAYTILDLGHLQRLVIFDLQSSAGLPETTLKNQLDSRLPAT